MKLDRLVKLERRLAQALDRRLRDPGAGHDALELVPMILDHVEEHVVPTPGGGRSFPYDRIAIEIAVALSAEAATRVVLDHPPGLAERVRARLREARCAAPAGLEVVTRLVAGTRPAGEPPFRIEYRERRTTQEDPAPRPSGVPRVRLTVVAGSSGAKAHDLDLERINLGRMPRVEDAGRGTVRHNHIAFADDRSDVNATVSRAHAHLAWDAEAEAFVAFDDGSAHGTRVLRSGRAIAVPRQGSRGVRLRSGDEIELGAARIRFALARPGRGAGARSP
jgi:hypothetical protein